MTVSVKVREVQGENEEVCWVIPNDAELEQVRHAFNPSGSHEVWCLKVLSAALIAAVTKFGKDPRLTSLARTAAEEAGMWAVKSATSGTEEEETPDVA